MLDIYPSPTPATTKTLGSIHDAKQIEALLAIEAQPKAAAEYAKATTTPKGHLLCQCCFLHIFPEQCIYKAMRSLKWQSQKTQRHLVTQAWRCSPSFDSQFLAKRITYYSLPFTNLPIRSYPSVFFTNCRDPEICCRLLCKNFIVKAEIFLNKVNCEHFTRTFPSSSSDCESKSLHSLSSFIEYFVQKFSSTYPALLPARDLPRVFRSIQLCLLREAWEGIC